MEKNVHTEHCCVFGCKYGDTDCPVETGLQKPSYPCEDCYCSYFDIDEVGGAEIATWWQDLDPNKKRYIFLENNTRRTK